MHLSPCTYPIKKKSLKKKRNKSVYKTQEKKKSNTIKMVLNSQTLFCLPTRHFQRQRVRRELIIFKFSSNLSHNHNKSRRNVSYIPRVFLT